MKNNMFKLLPLSILITASNVYAEESIEDMENFFKEIIQEDVSTDQNIKPEIKKEPVVKTESRIKEEENTTLDDLEELEELIPEPKKDSSSELDVVFLRNVPEGTRFTVKEDFIILPLHKYVIFHEGEVVVKSPQHKNPLTTFCYMELQPSGKARILKEGRRLTVIKNETTSKIYKSKKEAWRGEIKVFETKLHIDNPHLKSISCYSASSVETNKIPLRIKDLKEQTGNSLSIEFPAYEEI